MITERPPPVNLRPHKCPADSEYRGDRAGNLFPITVDTPVSILFAPGRIHNVRGSRELQLVQESSVADSTIATNSIICRTPSLKQLNGVRTYPECSWLCHEKVRIMLGGILLSLGCEKGLCGLLKLRGLCPHSTDVSTGRTRS